MAQQINSLEQLFKVIIARLGLETGKKIRAEIDGLIKVENVDISKIQDLIKTIQKILDADPSTPEFDVAKNIIVQITNLKNQIQVNANGIKNLQTKIEELQKEQSETTDKKIGSLQKQINQINDKTESLDKTKADASFVEDNFISKNSIFSLNIDKLIGGFVHCMEKGFEDTTLTGCTENTQQTKDNTENNSNSKPETNTTNKDNSTSSASASSSNESQDSSDGGVL